VDGLRKEMNLPFVGLVNNAAVYRLIKLFFEILDIFLIEGFLLRKRKKRMWNSPSM